MSGHDILAAQLVNPKDVAAQAEAKTRLDLLEPAGDKATADALAFGAEKYGPRNYVLSPIAARVYVAAMRRHLTAWLQGEDCAEDSGVHHLGHVAANCHIALAAIEAGTFIDDRHGRESTDSSAKPGLAGQVDETEVNAPVWWAEECREADRVLAELGQYPKGEHGFRTIAERVRALAQALATEAVVAAEVQPCPRPACAVDGQCGSASDFVGGYPECLADCNAANEAEELSR